MSSKPRRNTKESTRLTMQDWVSAAEAVLASRGIDAVGVEPLAKQLKVTKGSFYWHFSGRRELLLAVLNDWRKRATNAIIKKLSSEDLSPEDTLYELLTLPKHGSHALEGANLESAIRQWAKNDDMAKNAVDEVNELRMDFISRAYRDLGFDAETARAKAFFFYCTMQGMASLQSLGSSSIMAKGKEFLTKDIADS